MADRRVESWDACELGPETVQSIARRVLEIAEPMSPQALALALFGEPEAVALDRFREVVRECPPVREAVECQAGRWAWAAGWAIGGARVQDEQPDRPGWTDHELAEAERILGELSCKVAPGPIAERVLLALHRVRSARLWWRRELDGLTGDR